MSQKKGYLAEQKALDFLEKQGLNLIARNYYCRLGEIDLVMNDPVFLVFIEVRSRISNRFGGGLGSITYAKKQKIIKATSHYLLTHKIREQQAIRFDVVSIDGASGELTWIKDAFSMDY